MRASAAEFRGSHSRATLPSGEVGVRPLQAPRQPRAVTAPHRWAIELAGARLAHRGGSSRRRSTAQNPNGGAPYAYPPLSALRLLSGPRFRSLAAHSLNALRPGETEGTRAPQRDRSRLGPALRAARPRPTPARSEHRCPTASRIGKRSRPVSSVHKRLGARSRNVQNATAPWLSPDGPRGLAFPPCLLVQAARS